MFSKNEDELLKENILFPMYNNSSTLNASMGKSKENKVPKNSTHFGGKLVENFLKNQYYFCPFAHIFKAPF